jgi:Fe-S cluster assembly protein SufD
MSLADAIASRDVSLLPGRRDEAWRWSDLRSALRVLPPPSEPATPVRGSGPFDALADRIVLIVNGRGENVIEVAAGASLTVALRFVAAANAGAHVSRLDIRVGQDARLVLLESHEGEGAAYAVDAALSVALEDRAYLERIVLLADAADAISVTSANMTLGAQAILRQTVLASGALRQRIETRVAHPGAGASVRLDGLYLADERRHTDQTTVVRHDGVDGATDQLVKGVVRGSARAVFQGRIEVAPGADRTDARMGHHALILSDAAEVDAKPELEIYADDVACAHGATVGALDEDALFYARQRGLSETEARALLTRAFLGAVLDRIDHDGARQVAAAWVESLSEAAP